MTPLRHRLTHEPRAAQPSGAIRDPDEERRYWHQVGIAARARVHRELLAEGEAFCPICEEALRA